MMLKDQKTSIIEANRTHEKDTGSPEVQVAISPSASASSPLT